MAILTAFGATVSWDGPLTVVLLAIGGRISDGTTRHIDMYKTDDTTIFDMGGVTTSSIKLSGFTT